MLTDARFETTKCPSSSYRRAFGYQVGLGGIASTRPTLIAQLRLRTTRDDRLKIDRVFERHPLACVAMDGTSCDAAPGVIPTCECGPGFPFRARADRATARERPSWWWRMRFE